MEYLNIPGVAEPIVSVAHAAFVERVTVKPPSIVTTSPAIGTVAPEAPPDVADQVLVEFQLLVDTENRLAALALDALIIHIVMPITNGKNLNRQCVKSEN